MKNSFIPEKPLLVYPSIAATLGLEESVMLASLSDLVCHTAPVMSNGFGWFRVTLEQLLHAMPFWDRRDIQRVSTNLRDKGVIIVGSAPIEYSDEFKFAFNEKLAQQGATSNHIGAPTASQPAQPHRTQPSYSSAPMQRAASPAPTAGTVNAPSAQATMNPVTPRPAHDGHFLHKNYIAPNWQPDEDTLAQLSQLSVPSQFALLQVPEFVTYWRERGEAHHSWGSKFINHAIRKWRDHESAQHKKNSETAMHNQWRPSVDAIDTMTQQANIPRAFIDDAVPEFILYWQERGDTSKTWNSKFIQHVRLQWKKFTSAVESSTDPRPIPANWQPSEDVYDVLRLANIDIGFAQQLIPEFVIYWKDSNQIHTSWNTRYLQHVKRQWAQRHALNSAPNGVTSANRSTRDITLEEELTDRSWAN